MNTNVFCSYHFIINTSQEKKIGLILDRLNHETTIFEQPSTVQPYYKDPNKIEVFGTVILPLLDFDNVLMWLLKQFQYQFYGWHISGDYEHEINLKAEKCRESDLCFVGLTLIRLLN